MMKLFLNESKILRCDRYLLNSNVSNIRRAFGKSYVILLQKSINFVYFSERYEYLAIEDWKVLN